MNAQMSHVPAEVNRIETEIELRMRELLEEDPDAYHRILRALDRASRHVEVVDKPMRLMKFEMAVPAEQNK